MCLLYLLPGEDAVDNRFVSSIAEARQHVLSEVGGQARLVILCSSPQGTADNLQTLNEDGSETGFLQLMSTQKRQRNETSVNGKGVQILLPIRSAYEIEYQLHATAVRCFENLRGEIILFVIDTESGAKLKAKIELNPNLPS